MDIKRRHFIHQTKIRINELENIQKNDDLSIIKIKAQGINDYTNRQIELYHNKKEERQTEIAELNDKINKISLGHLDEYITTEVAEHTQKHSHAESVQREKKKIKEEDKQAKNIKGIIRYKNDRRNDREDYYRNREMDRSHKHYMGAVSTIPEYMEKNLKQMPNNKGYIWKSVCFFGYLRSEHNKPTLLFEKHKGLMKIHEWTNTEYNLYHKIGNQKTLIQNCPKTQRQLDIKAKNHQLFTYHRRHS